MGCSQDNTNHMRKGEEEEAKMPKKSELGLILRNKLSRNKETKREKKSNKNEKDNKQLGRDKYNS